MFCAQGQALAQATENLVNPTRSTSVEATPVAPAGNVAGETPIAPTGSNTGENPIAPAGNVVGETPVTPDKNAEANPNPSSTAQWPELPPLDAAAYLPDAKARVRLELRLGERRVYLYEDDKVTASYPVAIGKSSTPTPTGEYKVFQLIENPIWKNPWTGQVTAPGANSALGLRWIGFAQMSNGIIGFHGTPTVSSIGQAASNGCVRMHNEDVVALFSKVEMGTPVTVIR
ncbi:L,D-transpeptidase [Oscillatoria sp. FACHB-1406]|nr:L,D-transpeptidase [Oscillatoria sp. FACHB-1406]